MPGSSAGQGPGWWILNVTVAQQSALYAGKAFLVLTSHCGTPILRMLLPARLRKSLPGAAQHALSEAFSTLDWCG